MSVGGFQRVTPLGDGFIRGPARILIAPYAIAFPSTIGEVINLKGFETINNKELATEEATWKNCEQEIPKAEGTEKGFFLGFGSYATKELGFGAKGSEFVSALEELPTIGVGGIECTEPTKKITEEKLIFKFAGELKNHAQPLIQVLRNTTGKTYGPFKYKQRGYGLYDPYVPSAEATTAASNWTDLGASKGGIKIMRNNTESLQDIDQIQAAVGALPDEWEMSVEAPLAETNLKNIEVAWEGGEEKTTSTTPIKESYIGLGNPLSYVERRLAIIHKKTLGSSQGKLTMHLFRRVTRSAVASTIDFQKTGNMATIATNFRCFADTYVAEPNYQMGIKIDQNYF